MLPFDSGLAIGSRDSPPISPRCARDTTLRFMAQSTPSTSAYPNRRCPTPAAAATRRPANPARAPSPATRRSGCRGPPARPATRCWHGEAALPAPQWAHRTQDTIITIDAERSSTPARRVTRPWRTPTQTRSSRPAPEWTRSPLRLSRPRRRSPHDICRAIRRTRVALLDPRRRALVSGDRRRLRVGKCQPRKDHVETVLGTA